MPIVESFGNGEFGQKTSIFVFGLVTRYKNHTEQQQ